MRIAILGTRGIPNFYGGFEQFAEYLSNYLSEKGYEVYVYCSNDHPYKENKWKAVNLIHKPDPEDRIGTIGQFIYDFFCILDTRKRNFDVILQLGYTSNSIWHKLLPKKSLIITNMDGLEWKRTKYKPLVKKFLHLAERWAVKNSDIIIADSLGIQKYLYSRYKKTSIFIPYGANLFQNPEISFLKKYNLEPLNYNLIIARLEPENNVEIILDGTNSSKENTKILVIGNTNTNFGEYLIDKYSQNPNIIFIGGVYSIIDLNNLRYYSNIYFHGHSVGGTNPSLLEAMASNCLICAHKNIFNTSILGDDAFYFEDYTDIVKLLESKILKINYNHKIQKNNEKIIKLYSWETILKQYETLILNSV